MGKIDRTVLKETGFIASCVGVFSLLMEAVFLVTGFWSLSVLLGNLLGAAAAIGNFLLLGLTVQKAIKKEEKEAATLMKTSMTARNLMLFVVAMIGAIAPCFHLLAVVLPFLFPRLSILLRSWIDRKREKKES